MDANKKPLAKTFEVHLKYMILGAAGGAILGTILHFLSLHMHVPGVWVGFEFSPAIRRFTFDLFDLLWQVFIFVLYGMSILEILRAVVVGIPMGWKIVTGRFEPIGEETHSAIFRGYSKPWSGHSVCLPNLPKSVRALAVL